MQKGVYKKMSVLNCYQVFLSKAETLSSRDRLVEDLCGSAGVWSVLNDVWILKDCVESQGKQLIQLHAELWRTESAGIIIQLRHNKIVIVPSTIEIYKCP
jgi:hypothetical protein